MGYLYLRLKAHALSNVSTTEAGGLVLLDVCTNTLGNLGDGTCPSPNTAVIDALRSTDSWLEELDGLRCGTCMIAHDTRRVSHQMEG